jgi:hypothetical protein
VTRVDKVGGHAAAHVPQADESDVHDFHHAAVSCGLAVDCWTAGPALNTLWASDTNQERR